MRYRLTKYNWNIRPCSQCKKLLDFEHFDLDKRASNGIKSSCKKCSRDLMVNIYEKNKNHYREKKLIKSYGITLKEYDNMLLEQNGVCAICENENPPNSGSLAVDHNHTTGEVRGLLCIMCNRGLGNFYDNIQNLSCAIQYLSKD